MNKQPKKVLVEYRNLETRLTFFGNDTDKLYQTTIHGFNQVAERVYELAWMAQRGENGLELIPAYPIGSGVFIWRKDD